MSWETVNTIAGIAGVIVLALAFGFGTLAFYAQWKVNKAQKEEGRIKEEALSLELKNKDLQIAEADRKAAEANDSAAKLNERAQAFERDNLILRDDVNRAAGEVAVLQKDAANARATQQKVETELAKQQERAVNAERALLELEERRKPRHFTPKQKALFIDILKLRPKMSINILCVDGEACSFAKDIASSLKEAGWTDVRGGDGSVFSVLEPFFGVRLKQRNRGDALPALQAVYEAFKAVGIIPDVKYDMTQTQPEDVIVLLIGVKP